MLDPRRVLTFGEVARRRSFSRAAEELSLTQSAVSQQVAALERQAGVRLLHRGRGGVQVTPAGRGLLAHAEALAERLELAGAQLGEAAAEAGAALRVGAFPSALATVVPKALSRLLLDHPDLRVEVEEASSDALATGVRDGSLHLAVCFQDAAAARREPERTRREELGQEAMVVVLPPGHRLARRRSVDLEELAHDPWTAPSRDGIIQHACVAAGFSPRITVVTRDPLAVRAVVAAGLGVTLSPASLVPLLHGVAVLELRGEPPRRATYALLPDAGVREVERELLDHLRAAIADGPR